MSAFGVEEPDDRGDVCPTIERAPGVSVEEIISKTEGDLVVPAVVPEMHFD